MNRTAAAMLSVAGVLACAAPAAAQRNDGIDNPPAEQRIADELRSAGSRCRAPACRNNADRVYPPSTGQGYGAKSPSIAAGQRQPKN